MFGEKIIRKVPGQSFVNPKEKQGYIDDLSTKTRPELLDLLNRQTTLLENKGFIANLPDKGEKIKALKQRLEEALTRLDKVDQTCGLFSNLSLTSRGGISEEIEWTGKYSGSQHSDEDSETDDIENDETDPLKILVSQGNVGTFKKKNHSKMEPSDTFDEDLKICETSWNRISNSLSKDGFREGVSAGRDKVFQSAFDIGYSEGCSYGRRFGFLRGAINTLKLRQSEFNKADSINNISLHDKCIICLKEKGVGKVSHIQNSQYDEEGIAKTDESHSGLISLQKKCMEEIVDKFEKQHSCSLKGYNVHIK